MVKTIAEQNGVRMLSLFGFMGYSIAFLIPVFLLITLIFFRSRRRGEIFRDRRTPTVAGSSGETRIELDSWPLLGQDLFMRYSVAVAPLLLAQTASSASIPESGHEGFGLLLLALAGLVLAARLAGMAAERLRQPAILGELLAGVALGNVAAPLLGGPGATLIQGRGPLAFLAEMGILLLLFGVGLESDVRALARVGLSATLVALLGAITPLALGWGVAAWLLPDAAPVTHLFIGATLAATSVGITSRVLKDLGAIRTPAAQVILGAAILDDILGLVLLATVTGIVRTGSAGGVSAGGILAILLKAGLLLGAAIVLGHSGSRRIVALAVRTGQRDFLLAIGVALCFSLAFLAERLGLASILGAFAAGLILDPYGQGVAAEGTDTTLEEMLQPLEGLFAPLFFVVIGLQVQLQILADARALAFGLLLTLAALLGKLVCIVGVWDRRADRLTVAFGMFPRGEVGLIFAGVGTSLAVNGAPLASPATFSAVILMVLLTTLCGPVALRWAVRRRQRHSPLDMPRVSRPAA